MWFPEQTRVGGGEVRVGPQVPGLQAAGLDLLVGPSHAAGRHCTLLTRYSLCLKSPNFLVSHWQSVNKLVCHWSNVGASRQPWRLIENDDYTVYTTHQIFTSFESATPELRLQCHSWRNHFARRFAGLLESLFSFTQGSYQISFG